MPMNFPASPTNGQEFTAPNGRVYVWDGATWLLKVGGSAVAVGGAPPADPQDNTLWWSSTTGLLSIRYNDGNSQQWVGLNGSMAAAVVIGDAPPAVTFPGMLWWESDTGELSIRYNDGDSEQWVSVVAGPTALPRTQIINVTATTPAIDITIPDDINVVRISGIYCHAYSGLNDLLMRISYDGVNFDSAASGPGSYWLNVIQQSGSNGAPLVSGATEVPRAYMVMASYCGQPFPTTIEAVFDVGGAGRSPGLMSTYFATQTGIGASAGIIGTRGYSNGRAKKIRFLGINANIGVGTKLLLEMF